MCFFLPFVRALLALEQGDCRRAALLARALELHTEIGYVSGIEDGILCAAELASQWRQPTHILLVGKSYSGMVIIAVADQMPERLAIWSISTLLHANTTADVRLTSHPW